MVKRKNAFPSFLSVKDEVELTAQKACGWRLKMK
jgi:hypothetical protein